MEFQYVLYTQFPYAMSDVSSGIRAQIKAASDAGFDIISVGEHHVTDKYYLQNEPALSFAAPLVDDVDLATGICLLPYHNPVRIAEYGATMDVLTDGGFRLGVGQGYRQKEYEVFGVNKQDAPALLKEGIEIIKLLWTQDRVDFHGDYFEFEDISINPQPIQDPRPPIYVGASNTTSIRRAAQIGDGWYGSHHPFDLVEKHVKTFREEDNGDGVVGLNRRGFLAETDEIAETKAKKPLMDKYETYIEWGQSDVFEEDTFEQAWENLKKDRVIIGGPDTVVEEINRYKSAFDLDFMSFHFGFATQTFDELVTMIELFGDEVIPRF